MNPFLFPVFGRVAYDIGVEIMKWQTAMFCPQLYWYYWYMTLYEDRRARQGAPIPSCNKLLLRLLVDLVDGTFYKHEVHNEKYSEEVDETREECSPLEDNASHGDCIGECV